jgi:protein involved in polysaccharide export with SLBB domain
VWLVREIPGKLASQRSKEDLFMKLSQITALLLVALLMLGSQHVYAQTLSAENLRNINIDNISDEDIKSYYQKAVNAGYNQEQMLRLAGERGMPAVEVNKLRQRLVLISASPSVPSDTSKARNGTVSSSLDRGVDEAAMKLPTRRLTRDSTIFGSELFMENSMVFEPNLRIPSPANYILGPDDQLQISVYGYSEQSYNPIVNAEGNIYIPNVGPIKVADLTIEAAADKIRNKLASTIYKAIRTGQTKVDVSLGKIRSIRVTVIGQVTRPGTYTVSSLTTLFNMLYQCGGPNDNGSYRNIELIRGNKVVRKVDLYAFLMQGDRRDNVLLQEQDVVRIPYYELRTELVGAVKRSGKYELKKGENFDQLLTYSGGFTDSAYRKTVKLNRLTDEGTRLIDLNREDFASYSPEAGDVISVGKGIDRILNKVSIKGAVFLPGDFELKPGMKLKDLIEMAGGLKPDAFKERGLIERYTNTLTRENTAFNVLEVMNGSQDITLQKFDDVTISSIFDLRDIQTVSIEGEVRNPGPYLYVENLMLKDIILKAGGLHVGANRQTVEISRRVEKPSITQKNFKQTEIFHVDLSQGLSSADAETILKPFDIIQVRSIPGYGRTRSVFIEGQIMNEGRYILENSGERLSSLLKRAGGFRASADSNSITVRRFINSNIPLEERQRIVERLLNIDRDSLENSSRLRDTYLKNVELLGVNMGKLLENPGGNEDLIMEDGDVISVARASNLVKVSGEVYNPTLLAYENNSSAKYYIKRSGSFTSNARKTSVFVIYPDGRAKAVEKFLWFKNYPAVTPRSEVYVPSKSRDNKKGFGPGEWIAISSIIASLATMVVAVVNATR